MGVQPCWNQTKIINTSRHQQLLADLARRGPACWLIPKGKNQLWFPSSPRTRWWIGAERTAEGSGHKAWGGHSSAGGCAWGGDVQGGNGTCWLNSLPPLVSPKKLKNIYLKSPVVRQLGMK